MQTTAEVRWFYQGKIPVEVAEWFANSAGPIDYQPPRVDDYLLIPDANSVNVKLREGRIEIKQRYGAAVRHRFAGGSAGNIEFWRKWGFDVAQGSSNGDFEETADTWLAVRKGRMARTYALQAEGGVTPLTDLREIEHGCSLELTEIEAGGEHWWSLCFEGLGLADRLMETLVTVADQVLATSNTFRLDNHDSCGYAAWLQRFVHRVPPI
jgi:hypothetical protein